MQTEWELSRKESQARHDESEQRRMDEAEAYSEARRERYADEESDARGRTKRTKRIVAWMVRHGWEEKCMGGIFQMAIMFSPDGKRCLKIGGTSDGWGDFILWATKQKSVHAPRVHNIVDRREEHGYIAVIMERLYSVRIHGDNTTPVTTPAAVDRVARYEKYRKRVNGNAVCQDRDALMKSGTLGRFVVKLADACNHGEMPNDLHGGNVMVRVNDQGFPIALVVTDPLA
jgi:hypothetical protein